MVGESPISKSPEEPMGEDPIDSYVKPEENPASEPEITYLDIKVNN